MLVVEGVRGMFWQRWSRKGNPRAQALSQDEQGEGPETTTEAALGHGLNFGAYFRSRLSSEWHAFTTTGKTEMNKLTLNLRERHTGETMRKKTRRKQEEHELHSESFLHCTRSVPCN